MVNQHIVSRLDGVWAQLQAAHKAGVTLSSSSKGREREDFIDLFLKNVFPPIYRFGTGDVTDIQGAKSGQLDVVIELPFSPTLPAVGTGQVRLYPAESAAAVIEVKSNLSAQWGEVRRTAQALRPIRRKFGASMIIGTPPAMHIPIIAVGFQGWSTIEGLRQNVEATPEVDAALVIESGLFVTSVAQGAWSATGIASLWALISFLHHQLTSIQSASTDPLAYLR